MIERGINRAAILAWRDDATLTAMDLLHAASIVAMQALEDQIDTIAVASAMSDADTTAREIVRPTMRLETSVAIDAWFSTYAEALHRIDPRLEALALWFGAVDERPTLPQDVAIAPAGWKAPTWLRSSASAIGSVIDRAATEVASRALSDEVRKGAEQISTRIGRAVGEHSGAHDRLRAAARIELSRVWLGSGAEGTEPQPYLALLFGSVDQTAKKAVEAVA